MLNVRLNKCFQYDKPEEYTATRNTGNSILIAAISQWTEAGPITGVREDSRTAGQHEPTLD